MRAMAAAETTDCSLPPCRAWLFDHAKAPRHEVITSTSSGGSICPPSRLDPAGGIDQQFLTWPMAVPASTLSRISHRHSQDGSRKSRFGILKSDCTSDMQKKKGDFENFILRYRYNFEIYVVFFVNDIGIYSLLN